MLIISFICSSSKKLGNLIVNIDKGLLDIFDLL